jgi:heparanase 1
MKACRVLLFASVVGGLAVVSEAQNAAVSLDPSRMPATRQVDERFQSYNVEMIEVTGGRFWAPYKQDQAAPADTAQATPGGMPASLYRYRAPIDLANPKLRKLAAALGPAYIRVSGTWANSTFFQDSDDPPPVHGAPTDGSSSVALKPPAGFNGVLTRAQWRGVIDFAHATDAKLVTSFAVSQGVRDAKGVWAPAEAEKVIKYTRSVGGSIAAAEFFNEPTFATLGGAPKGYDAAAYGRDFRAFHAYIKKAAPEIEILGPGSIGEAQPFGQMPGIQLLRSEDMLEQQGPGLLDAFSYHFYGGLSQRCARMGLAGATPEAALTHEWLARTERDEAFYAALRDRFAPGKPVWLTETGETACGGDPWASSFIDSFRYLYQLGMLARTGVQVVMHNTLNASDYALLDEATLTPRPNYWAAVLWRRLMGTKVLDPAASSQPDLYVFAHCLRGTKGGVAILAINADKANAHNLSVPAKSARYTLTSADLLSSTIQLNGAELALTSGGDLPALDGVPQASGQIALAPASITFLGVPAAENASCR